MFDLQPALQLAPALQPGRAELSWTPADATGFVLQYNDNLSSTNWINLPSGTLNPVPIATTNGRGFYRLARP